MYQDENLHLENNFKVSKINTEQKITIYYYLTILKVEYFFNIETIVPKTLTIKDLIPKAITAFNEKKFEIEINGEIFILSYEPINETSKYELRQTKKNFKPKIDMPPFYDGAIIENVQHEKFSLVPLNKKSLKVTKVYLDNEKEDKTKNNSKSMGHCLIY